MMIRTGIGFDAHCFAGGRRLILGGVEIPHQEGLAGHSDADVLTHAVIDAVLGALADGDIGTHFSDRDAQWKDACSLDLLRIVCGRMRERHGGSLNNIDVTVIAEAPRLSDYVQQMRVNLADAMGILPEAVSVKATTVEKMGALGRREGIAALSVATLELKQLKENE